MRRSHGRSCAASAPTAGRCAIASRAARSSGAQARGRSSRSKCSKANRASGLLWSTLHHASCVQASQHGLELADVEWLRQICVDLFVSAESVGLVDYRDCDHGNHRRRSSSQAPRNADLAAIPKAPFVQDDVGPEEGHTLQRFGHCRHRCADMAMAREHVTQDRVRRRVFVEDQDFQGLQLQLDCPPVQRNTALDRFCRGFRRASCSIWLQGPLRSPRVSRVTAST